MGKIENCFESREEGAVFAFEAYEHPLLRITARNISEGTHRSVDIQAAAGFVCSTDLVEPPESQHTEPALAIEPASFASVALLTHPIRFKPGQQLANLEVRVIPGTDLLVRNPVNDPSKVELRVKSLIKLERPSLTLSRNPAIRKAMIELEAEQAVSPIANVMWRLSSIALAGLWQRPTEPNA